MLNKDVIIPMQATLTINYDIELFAGQSIEDAYRLMKQEIESMIFHQLISAEDFEIAQCGDSIENSIIDDTAAVQVKKNDRLFNCNMDRNVKGQFLVLNFNSRYNPTNRND